MAGAAWQDSTAAASMNPAKPAIDIAYLNMQPCWRQQSCKGATQCTSACHKPIAASACARMKLQVYVAYAGLQGPLAMATVNH